MTAQCNGMEKLQEFAARVESEYRDRLVREHPTLANLDDWARVTVKPGRTYTRVNVGSSGKYMVVNATGEIYGIKGYGQVHRGHWYGTLDTIDLFDWSGYVAVRKEAGR